MFIRRDQTYTTASGLGHSSGSGSDKAPITRDTKQSVASPTVVRRPIPIQPTIMSIEQLLARRTQQLSAHPSQSPSNLPPPTSLCYVPTPRQEFFFECIDPTAIQRRNASNNYPTNPYNQPNHLPTHWHGQAPFLLPTTTAPLIQTIHPLLTDAEQAWSQRWREMVTTQLPKHHAYQTIRSTLQNQQRTKLSATIAKEYLRLLQRQFRCVRDVNLRGRRLVREVAAYWRRAEKESIENRKRAEREEIENRRKLTEQKEQERQKKKLEFLLTQTELYSHFIGRKMNAVETKAEAPASTAATAAVASSTVTPDPTAMNDTSTSTASTSASILAHASTVRNEANVTAEEAARSYIANQRSKMAEFDQLESRTTNIANSNGPNSTAPMTDENGQPINDTNPSPSAAPAVDELDLLNPSTMPEQESFVQAAKNFHGTLKSYQLRGLNWLLNLYEQGINGILADEMGLGKTVQSISFLSYLAGSKDIWGPFLIVAPNSTLHQWQQEVTRFAPDLKILPYWGSAKERQILRQFWTSKQLYTKDAPFHILITSYNVVVQDEKYFHRMRFMYMVLDEAQAIKNAASQRWKCLLNLKCRNRVLLTGTPIQNSMAELWALLHFIMPEFFDNHEEFAEWFSKDVEDAATGESGGLDQRQVQRLHMILKPFMLRRVKKDVENEMPPKIEITLPCKLSAAQLRIYKTLQKKIRVATEEANGTIGGKKTFLSSLSGPVTFSAADVTASDSLVTLVMQFRKVCNHPELYEKKHVLSPYYFGHAIHYPATKQKMNAGSTPAASKESAEAASGAVTSASHALLFIRCPASTNQANPIAQRYPSLLHQAIRVPSREKLINHTFNIFTAAHVYDQLYHHDQVRPFSTFSFLPFIDLTPMELEFAYGAEPLHQWLMLLVLHHRRTLATRRLSPERISLLLPPSALEQLSGELELVDQSPEINSSHSSSRSFHTRRICLAGSGFLWRDPSAFTHCLSLIHRLRRPCRPRVLASTPFPLWSHSLGSPSVHVDAYATEYAGWEKSVLLGVDAWKWANFQFTRNKQGCSYPFSLTQSLDLLPIGLVGLHRRTYVASPWTEQQAQALSMAKRRVDSKTASSTVSANALSSATIFTDPSTPLHAQSRALHSSSTVTSQIVPPLLDGVMRLGLPVSQMSVPTVEDLITDSGKLQMLDNLLTQLKREGHRVLIFSQFTKLIDLLENFLNYRKYRFARLDGQTALSARRDIVKRFQHDTSVFAFLLSTRAGGLGINLTAADTVIFYDNDWNPSSDAQAMDRVHRIGQTRQVTVYRLVCSNTVEERILIRAQQKHVIQNTVYAGGFKMAGHSSADTKSELQDLFSGSELQQLLENDPTAANASITPSPTTTTSNAPITTSSSPTLPSDSPSIMKGAKHPLDQQVKEESEAKRQKMEHQY